MHAPPTPLHLATLLVVVLEVLVGLRAQRQDQPELMRHPA